ncbi:unnamed protein product [Lathyrus sativus]|nr:unnamed protein product [Lathyrus sativus]
MQSTMQHSLISTSFLLLAITFYTTTTLAQLSPIQPPTTSSSPPLRSITASPPAPSLGLNTVPLVPTPPTGAPSPLILRPNSPSENNTINQPTQLTASIIIIGFRRFNDFCTRRQTVTSPNSKQDS